MNPDSRALDLPPLVMRCGAFGDMVLLTVLLQRLYVRFGRPVDVIASGPWSRPLLEGHPAVGRLFLIRSRRTPFWLSPEQRALVETLRRRGAGPTWFCDHGPGRELLHRAGIPDDYVCDVRELPWIPKENIADRYIRMSGHGPQAFLNNLPAAKPGAARAARIAIQPQARDDLNAWLARRGLCGRPLIVVHPGSRHLARRWLRSRSGATKYWPIERWAEVVRAVRRGCPDHAIVLSGTAAEHRLNADIIDRAAVADVHNVARDLPIPRLLALLERADSMISVDTGPAHAAAALGCPTVALFGVADPALYRPGGATTPAVSLTGEVGGSRSILGISAQTVIESWTSLPCRARNTLADLSQLVNS